LGRLHDGVRLAPRNFPVNPIRSRGSSAPVVASGGAGAGVGQPPHAPNALTRSLGDGPGLPIPSTLIYDAAEGAPCDFGSLGVLPGHELRLVSQCFGRHERLE
jgi:hypothetical protein